MLERHLQLLKDPVSGARFTLEKIITYRTFTQDNQTETDIVFGLVKAGKKTYPIIQGILYLKEERSRGAVKLIKQGLFSKSVDHVSDFPFGVSRLVKIIKPWGRLDRWMSRFGISTESLFSRPHWLLSLMSLYADTRPWLKYLINRRHNPTYANSLISVSLFSPGPSIDIGSGIGTFLPHMNQAVGSFKTLAIDSSFWNLYFSVFKNPTVTHICFDLNQPWPFKSGVFINMTFNDCLHCFANKKSVAQQTKKMLSKTGGAFFCHVHNHTDQKNFAGLPILFSHLIKEFKGHRIYAAAEQMLHQNVVRKNKILKLDSLKIDSRKTKAIDQQPSYMAFIFKTKPRPTKLSFKKYYQAGVQDQLQYDEDNWQ